MRLLIDNALSPRLAELLRAAGHDAIHIRDRIPPSSSDACVFELAAGENRILVSADSDFGVILATRAQTAPSLVLLRHDAPSQPSAQALLLDRVLTTAAAELRQGCVISVTKHRIRLRMLPLP